MYCVYDLQRARDLHQTRGGVLLDYVEMYVVCGFDEAVELRGDELEDPRDWAQYWAMMGECGYDETETLVRQLRARLADREHDLLARRDS
ncbi:MAG: hypothetical protein ACYC6Y_19675 [Thermoguttaceae bacterium]